MSTVIDLFERHGYVLELLACVAATTWKLERQERFAARLTGILLAEACFTIVWEQAPHNLYTESLRTFLLWSIAAVGIRLCFRIAAAWAVFYATAAGTMQHIIYRGAKLLQNAVYHMDRQDWAWSRWVYLGLFVLLFAVCCLTLTRRLHSRNLGTLPGRTMTFIMVGYQLSMNIFVNLFNAFSVDGAPRIFTTYSVYDEVTTILLFFLLCEILQRSDAEWDNMVLQQMMRQQRQQMELSKETVELINIKCHDIRKQLYTLGSRVPTEELDELKKAVDIYGSTVKTGQRDVGRAAGGALHRVQGPRHPAGLHRRRCKAGLPEARRGVLAVRQRAGQRHRGGDPAGAGPPLHRPAGAGRAGHAAHPHGELRRRAAALCGRPAPDHQGGRPVARFWR